MSIGRQGSRSRIVAGIAGGFGLLLFMLIAGFAGGRLAHMGERGWAPLVALLAACGILAAIGGVVVWQQYRQTMAGVDPSSVAGLRERRKVYSGVAGIALILLYSSPLVLVRQTYWAWAPWAALLSALVFGTLLVYLWRRSLHFADRYYSKLSPAELWGELQRHKSTSAKTVRRLFLVGSVLAGCLVVLVVVGYVFGLDNEATFPPRSIRQWFPILNACNLLFITLSTWSQHRVMERWQQTFHIVRG